MIIAIRVAMLNRSSAINIIVCGSSIKSVGFIESGIKATIWEFFVINVESLNKLDIIGAFDTILVWFLDII